MRWWLLLASILLHGLLIAWLRWSYVPPPTTPVQPITITYSSSNPPGAGDLRRPVRKRAGRPAAPGFKALKPGGDFGLAKRALNSGTGTDEDLSGWSSKNWGSGGGGLKQIEHTLQFDKLREEIEGLLNYPGRLARRGIEGTINARLVFGAGSRCDWKRTRVEGGQRYLRVYITALLKKLCRLETLEHLRLPVNQAVDLSFRFAMISALDPALVQVPGGPLMGNVILFSRLCPKLPLEYQLGPLRGSLLIPAVALDWPWVMEHWDTWFEGKDPLQEFREEN